MTEFEIHFQCKMDHPSFFNRPQITIASFVFINGVYILWLLDGIVLRPLLLYVLAIPALIILSAIFRLVHR